jgi:hypothetical protein
VPEPAMMISASVVVHETGVITRPSDARFLGKQRLRRPDLLGRRRVVVLKAAVGACTSPHAFTATITTIRGVTTRTGTVRSVLATSTTTRTPGIRRATTPGSYGAYYGGYFDPFDVGELRLIVSPRSGDVYVDGYFAGRVDDYDGMFQALKLEAGPHHIQIVAQGYAPLDFDVRIEPNRKITYRGTLRP